jgi:TPR repeat protein
MLRSLGTVRNKTRFSLGEARDETRAIGIGVGALESVSDSLLVFVSYSVPSRTRLGVMYLAGYGIKRSIPLAFRLFSEAAVFGDRDAQAHLAAMHLQGAGVEGGKKLDKAIELYRRAAEQGHLRAQATLAVSGTGKETTSSERVKHQCFICSEQRQRVFGFCLAFL